MKLTNFAILFSIIAVCILIILNAKVNDLSIMVQKNTEYNKAIDTAVDDATYDLVEYDSNREIYLNKDIAVEQFYTSLYSNFGVIGHSIKEKQLRAYIPIILITYTDGFYIYYTDTYEQNGDILICQRWTEKIPYSYEDDRFIYSFTLDSDVTVYDKQMNSIKKGDCHDVGMLYSDTILTDDNRFELERRNAIISTIEDSMTYYINQHNRIAKQYGITYNFSLPQIDKTDWNRTIDDISMLVVFQGYPYGTIAFDTYNRYALGGARIKKSSNYYIQRDGAENINYYHRSDCPNLTSMSMPYYTKEECALEGAYPCQECNP